MANKRWGVFGWAVLAFCALTGAAQAADLEFIHDVVYGHKDGMALTFDVIKPKTGQNGAAVIYMVSGGWVSSYSPPEQAAARFSALLDKGFVVIPVRHGSSPKYLIPDIVEDVRRAVRYIRFHAKDWGVDPDRLGVHGGSAGGHLSLVLGTASDDGNPNAREDFMRVSDRVASVVAYFPPTDLRNMARGIQSAPVTTADAGRGAGRGARGSAKGAEKGAGDKGAVARGGAGGQAGNNRFPALNFEREKAADYSPIVHVTADDPPALMIHGDADTLVPISNSRNILEAYKKVNVKADMITLPGAGHGFQGDAARKANEALVAWFEETLVKNPPKPKK